ncbi:hypothetical protein DMH26_28950 [Streptomyces sp. WAC 05379]|nr:hypothetical protein DMH26_28950 [Streptomyces sp. WAC 05379]
MATPPKPRAGRTPYGPPRPPTVLDLLRAISDLCGVCAGAGRVWCPECAGFAGCVTCRHGFMVPCPQCAGGDLEPMCW